MLLEGSNRAFSCIDMVIVGGNEVDVHAVALDVGFNCLGAFVVHDIERGHISTGVEGRKDVFEVGNHCFIILGWHGTDKDDIEVIMLNRFWSVSLFSHLLIHWIISQICWRMIWTILPCILDVA